MCDEYVAWVKVCGKEVCGCGCRGTKCVGICTLYVWDGVRSVLYKDTVKTPLHSHTLAHPPT